MNLKRIGRASGILGLLAVAALAAGCNGPTSSLGSPGADGPSSHVHPLQTVSTRVAIYNSGTVTISGTGSAACWSISPGLPNVPAGEYSSPITLTFNLDCVATNKLDITYGPTIIADEDCTFETTYNNGFTYKAVNSVLTDCSVSPSKNVSYDELFSWDPAGSLRRHH